MRLSEDNLEAGRLATQVLLSRAWVDHAPTMHAEVIGALRQSGFDVYPEFPIRLSCGGRIDLVADYGGGGRVGIELDTRKPRRKSVYKLNSFDGFRIIGLRGVQGHEVTGIDACVCLRVVEATKEQKADRRIYRSDPEWAHDWKGRA